MKIADFKSLPVSAKRLLAISGILAVFVALPLFLFAVTNVNFEIRNKAQVTQTPAPVPITFFEPFDGTGTIDILKFSWSGTTGSMFVRENDQLKGSVPQGSDQVGGNDAGIVPAINGNLIYPVGDFTASVDLNGIVINGSGSGYEQLAYGSEGVGIRRSKTGTQETIEVWNQINGSGSLNNKLVSVDLATGSGTVKVKMVKTGDQIQTFYDIGQGDIALTTVTLVGDLAPRLVVANDATEYPAITAYFDNYLLQTTIAGTPIPTASPESTESPSPSPSGSPEATPTLTPSPTPTGSPSTVSCNSSDINKDGIVDIIDYGIFVSDFFKTSPINSRSDINSDGIVDIIDYSMMVSKFFETTGICQ